MSAPARLGSSFRDPSGFIFRLNGQVYRHVSASYADEFEALEKAGFFQELIDDDLLLPFEKVDKGLVPGAGAAYVLKPEQLDWISYPYEWGFGQWRDAALCTLEVARRAFEKGFTLKDASAYNIQFRNGKPILIDTLSFETYEQGQPWMAYRQFCRHFLGPLAVMSYIDPKLGSLFLCHIDGLPLDLVAKMLPPKAKWNLGIRTHIGFHSKADAGAKTGEARPLSRIAMLALFDSLKRTVESLKWQPVGTEWANYYGSTNYSEAAEAAKKALVRSYLDHIPETAETCWDLGANDGSFSRLALERGLRTIGWDIDRGAVELGYRWMRKENQNNYLPLTLNLANPSPSIGWNLEERESFFDRGPVDVVLALALIHHLAISNNVPLPQIVEFLARVGQWVIVEFVPKHDSQVQRMLVARKDIFDDYRQDRFEDAIREKFEVVTRDQVPESERSIYLLRRKD